MWTYSTLEIIIYNKYIHVFFADVRRNEPVKWRNATYYFGRRRVCECGYNQGHFKINGSFNSWWTSSTINYKAMCFCDIRVLYMYSFILFVIEFAVVKTAWCRFLLFLDLFYFACQFIILSHKSIFKIYCPIFCSNFDDFTFSKRNNQSMFNRSIWNK